MVMVLVRFYFSFHHLVICSKLKLLIKAEKGVHIPDRVHPKGYELL